MFALTPGLGVETRHPVRVFVIGGFKDFGGSSAAHNGRSAEDFWRMPSSDEACSDFGFDRIDQQTTANGRSRRDWGGKPRNADHSIAHGRTGIEDQVGKILELFSGRMLRRTRFRMLATDN